MRHHSTGMATLIRMAEARAHGRILSARIATGLILIGAMTLAGCQTQEEDQTQRETSSIDTPLPTRMTDSSASDSPATNQQSSTGAIAEQDTLCSNGNLGASSLNETPHTRSTKDFNHTFSSEASMINAITVTIDGHAMTACLANTKAAVEFAELLANGPLTVMLRDYGGFEKVGSLGFSLTSQNQQTDMVPGDIMLYQGNNLVLMYGTNTWVETRLATINGLTDKDLAVLSSASSVTLSIPSTQ